jgi:hypothetical protein
MKSPMNPGSMETKEMKDRTADGPFIRPIVDATAAVELEDLSRFEGEGGPEAPAVAVELIDVPLKDAVWRRLAGAAHQTNQAHPRQPAFQKRSKLPLAKRESP